MRRGDHLFLKHLPWLFGVFILILISAFFLLGARSVFPAVNPNDPFISWARIHDSGADDDAYAVALTSAAGAQQNWVRQHPNPATGINFGRAIAVDGAGNSYVTGDVLSLNGLNRDIYTVKYNSSGAVDTTWGTSGGNRYDDLGDDIPHGIAVDSVGNVYITGQVKMGAVWKAVFIKHPAAGGTLSTYAISAFDSYGLSVAVDPNNNDKIYVVADVGSSALASDYTVLKYNASLSPDAVWNKKFGEPKIRNDYGRYVSVDGVGDVFVAGYIKSGSSATSKLLKYSGVSAATLCDVVIFDGTSKEVKAVAVGVSGAYTALVNHNDARKRGKQNGTPSDAINVERFLATSGCTQDSGYHPFYNGPAADDRPYDIAIGKAGDQNVYVTGETYNDQTGQYKFLTVKFPTQGTKFYEWAVTYTDVTSLEHRGRGIGLDNAGGVYVAGWSGTVFRIIKYFSAAQVNSNVYVAGVSHNGANKDIRIIPYNQNGIEIGPPVIYNSGFDDEARDVTTAGGFVYVAGFSADATGDKDFIVLKYSADLVLQTSWGVNGVATYDSGRNDEARGVAVDASGNVYVTGISNVADALAFSGSRSDAKTVRFDSLGNLTSWVKTFDSVFHNDDIATSVAIGPSTGNIFVAEYFCSTNGTPCASTPTTRDWRAKVLVYTPSQTGNAPTSIQSPVFFSGDLFYFDIVAFMNFSQERVVAIGCEATELNCNDFYVAEINRTTWPNPASSIFGGANSIAADTNGNIYVSGASAGGDYSTAKFLVDNTFGFSQVWFLGGGGDAAKLYDSGFTDAARGVAVDAAGGIYVTGSRSGIPGGTNDFQTIKYSLFPGVSTCPGPLGIVDWSDFPIVANTTPIRAVHILELRAAVNNQRSDVGVIPVLWSSPTPAIGNPVRGVHVQELRDALRGARSACGAGSVFTDEPIQSGITPIKALHINEIRNQIEARP